MSTRPMTRAVALLVTLAVPSMCLANEIETTGARLEGSGDQPVKVQIVEEENPDFHNRLSFGPLGLLFGVGNFAYERELVPSFALEIAPWGIYFGFGDDKIYGGAVGLGGVLYISGNAPEGLRLSFNVAPGFVGASAEDSSENVFMFGAKAMFGYNWVWKNGFSLGLSGGVQYLYFDIEGVSSALNGILPALDFNLGFCF